MTRWLFAALVALACNGCAGDDLRSEPGPLTPLTDDIFHEEDVFPAPKQPKRRRKRRKRPKRKPVPPVFPPPAAVARASASKPVKSQPTESDLAKQAARAALAQEETDRRKLAAAVATNIVSRKYSYDRNMLKQLQRRAGITPDGLYGGQSAGMLRHYLSPKLPPKPLFKPTTEVTYVPR